VAAPPPAKVQPAAGATPPGAAPQQNPNKILVLPSAAALGEEQQQAIVAHGVELPYEVDLLGGDSKATAGKFVLELVSTSGASNELTMQQVVGLAKAPVVHVRLANGQLALAWQKQKPEVETLLYDCALVINKSGTVAQIVQFRPIDSPEPLRLQSDSSHASSKVSFEKPTTLPLTLGVLNCPPAWDAIQTSGHKVQMRPKDQQVKLHFEVTLRPLLPTGSDRPTGATVDLKLFYEGSSSPVPKSRKDLETQRKQVENEINSAQEAKPNTDISQLRKKFVSLEAALTALEQLPPEPLRYRIYSKLDGQRIDFAISQDSSQ
jgi:hypothetical protein